MSHNATILGSNLYLFKLTALSLKKSWERKTPEEKLVTGMANYLMYFILKGSRPCREVKHINIRLMRLMISSLGLYSFQQWPKASVCL